MTAIVTTLLWLPAGALLAGFCDLVFGISPHAFVTFGGIFNEPIGVLAWWAAAFFPAAAYAALCLRD